ncbi:ParA family protein [Bradyrhizobium guangzhouense]|uniref:ParA family protein n=1 Tax=Bradyrhizobium guangzhouense TaxID=1325095 RepID=UPI001009A08A|nr:ParA family protein [Bradyrhizobium guangzhouense]RXH10111.1 ParA family protein [Bradyrhizobium guangzhouense]
MANPLIIAVAQRKGGVGKTTLAVCLAGELDRRTGGVGLIDADSQASACQWAQPGNLSFPVYELDTDSRPIADWVQMVRRIPHEILVIDCAPNDRALGAVLAIADIVLLPCMPSGLDIEATARTLGIVRRVRGSRRLSLRALIVPNRVDRRTLEGVQLTEELETLGEELAPAIGSRSAFVRAFAAGKSVHDVARGSPADVEIRGLADIVVRSFNLTSKVAEPQRP